MTSGRVRRCIMVVGAATVAGLLATPAGAATPTWNVQPTPNPTGANVSVLDGVSCISAPACTAAGSYINASGTNVTLAQRWMGAVWMPTRTPAGAAYSELSGVSCTSATACTAVGDYNYAAVAERWNGTVWRIQPTPTSGIGTTLDGVSCTSATACTAVGSYLTGADGTEATLAERWNGTAWKIQPTPNPGGPTDSYLSGVSCASASACSAVGYYSNASGTRLTLAEQWNGAVWKLQPTPNPTGATASYLDGVSCTSATACTAVGYSGGAAATLVERWNGTAWKIQPTPNPTGATGSLLNGVSCTSATACKAVGYYSNTSGTNAAAAESWNGTVWRIQPTPTPAGTMDSYLNGVSCTSVTACTAVGYYENASGTEVTLAERYS